MNPLVSVIIPVKNDVRINHTLNGLIHQEKISNFEIIVIDASTGELDDIKKIFADRVKWLYYKSSAINKRTTVAQVNYATKISKGSIVAYIDADCIPANNWLYNITLPIINDNEYFVAGYVKSKNNLNDIESIWKKLSNNKYVNHCPNMNSAINKTVFERIGYFDEKNFNYGWDMDFAWRATNSGYKIRFNPDAIVTHDWGDAKSNVKRNYYYGEAKIKLYKKHPTKVRLLLSDDINALKYSLLILSLPILVYFPPTIILFLYAVLKDTLRAKNPYFVTLSNFAYGFGFLKEFCLQSISKIALPQK